LGKANAENGAHLDKVKHFIRIFDLFREVLHERSLEMVNIYDDIHSWYSEKIKPQEHEEQGLDDLGQFMIEYLKQVDNLLQLTHAWTGKATWQHWNAS